MDTEKPSPPPRFPSFRNWLSLWGGVLAISALFAFILLFAIDSIARFNNPYLGVLTYIVAPGFLIMGLFFAALGAFLQHRRIVKHKPAPLIQLDLSRPHDRRVLGLVLAGSGGFLLITAIGSYYTYHFTESPVFCGDVCHTVMQPEMTTYQHSPHARVSCASCHIGPGATWFVRSKLSGTYQVYATIFNKYPRPIPTPVKNLRPAPETCERCHWPREFVGNLDRAYTYYLSDSNNPPFTLRMLLKVGGADPTRGPVGGIHWHMNVANRVEYIATDELRQKIPWVRLIDPQGVVTEYRTARFTNDISKYSIRVMDCMDCHNRPTHIFTPPDQAVFLAMRLGHIDAKLPYIQTNAVWALTRPYTNTTQGLRGIATLLSAQYPDTPQLTQAIAVVQNIYTNNFFPHMRANWRDYPNDIGHMIFPGCTRCHDNQHLTADKKQKIRFSECMMCHVILAQGSGEQLLQLNAEGHKFAHPGGELGPDDMCYECHTGGP